MRPDAEFQRRQRSAGVAARPRQPHLFDLRRPAAHARLFRQGRLHHRLTRTRSPCRPSPRKASRWKTSDVVAASPSLSRPAAQLAALFVAATTSLAGCGVNYASNDPVPPGDYHERHPIVACRRRRPTLDVFPTGGALDQQSIANIQRLRRTLPRVRRRADRHSRPGRRARPRRARRSTEIRRALAGAGLRGYVAVGSYPDADADAALRRSGWCSRA